MTSFFQSYQVTISTLSPVHIGSGDDYEPTNYVIENSILYSFQLQNAIKHILPVNAASSLTLSNVWDAFHKKINDCKSVATHYVTTNKELKETQQHSLATGRIRPIERTSTSAGHKPYIPGSSIKGAIRTAVLNQLATSQHVDRNAVELNLLGGCFESDPFRLLKLSDAMPSEYAPFELTHICSNQNRHRKDGTVTSIGDQRQKFFECIHSYLNAAFFLEMRCYSAPGSPNQNDNVVKSFDSIAKICTSYYQKHLDIEILNMEQCLSKNPGLKMSLKHLKEIQQFVGKQHNGFLLQVGKFSGADTLVIDKYKNIKTKYRTETPISTNFCNIEGKQFPYGWIWVALQDSQEFTEKLIRFRNELFNIEEQTHRIAQFQATKQTFAIDQQKRLAEQADQQGRDEAKDKAEHARQAALAAMSAAQRKIEILCEALAKATKVKQPGSDIAKETMRIMEHALDDDAAPRWHNMERQLLAEKSRPLLKEKSMLVGKDEKTFKSLLRRLSGEDS